MEENMDSWCAPDIDLWAMLPEIQIKRGGIMYPMPQFETSIMTERKRRFWRVGRYFVHLRQYGRDKIVRIGPFSTLMQARNAETELYAWYTTVYNVIISTYKATERNKR